MIRLLYFKVDVIFVHCHGSWLGCYNKYGGYVVIFHTYLENPRIWSQLGNHQADKGLVWCNILVHCIPKRISTLYRGVGLGCVAIATGTVPTELQNVLNIMQHQMLHYYDKISPG
jgi:hypothetical protein